MFEIARKDSHSVMNSKEKEKSEKPILFKIEDSNILSLLKKKTLRFEIKKKNEKKSSLKKSEPNSKEGRWTLEEHSNFVKAIAKYHTIWKKIEKEMISKIRTRKQIISYFQKFFKKLKKCKDNKLGIDFTSKFIINIKDMKKHIETVNSNYNIVDIFMHVSKD